MFLNKSRATQDTGARHVSLLVHVKGMHSDSCCIKSCGFLHGIVAGVPFIHEAGMFRCLWWAERSERLKEALNRWRVGTVIQIFWCHFSWSPGLLWPQRGKNKKIKKKSVSPQPKYFFFFCQFCYPLSTFLWVFFPFIYWFNGKQ